MKQLWNVLIEKLKEVDANFVSIGIGIFALIALMFTASIINNLIKMIITIVQVIAGSPVALG